MRKRYARQEKERLVVYTRTRGYFREILVTAPKISVSIPVSSAINNKARNNRKYIEKVLRSSYAPFSADGDSDEWIISDAKPDPIMFFVCCLQNHCQLYRIRFDGNYPHWPKFETKQYLIYYAICCIYSYNMMNDIVLNK